MANWKDIIAGEVTDDTSIITTFAETPLLPPEFPAPEALEGEPTIINQCTLINAVTKTITVFYSIQQNYKDAAGNTFFSFNVSNKNQHVPDLCPEVDIATATINLAPSSIVGGLVEFNFENITINYKKCVPSKITVWAES